MLFHLICWTYGKILLSPSCRGRSYGIIRKWTLCKPVYWINWNNRGFRWFSSNFIFFLQTDCLLWLKKCSTDDTLQRLFMVRPNGHVCKWYFVNVSSNVSKYTLLTLKYKGNLLNMPLSNILHQNAHMILTVTGRVSGW